MHAIAGAVADAVQRVDLVGSTKAASAWTPVGEATVYYDHPVHTFADHTLNIDVRRPADGPSARVAIELTSASARDLAETILRVLDGQESVH